MTTTKASINYTSTDGKISSIENNSNFSLDAIFTPCIEYSSDKCLTNLLKYRHVLGSEKYSQSNCSASAIGKLLESSFMETIDSRAAANKTAKPKNQNQPKNNVQTVEFDRLISSLADAQISFVRNTNSDEIVAGPSFLPHKKKFNKFRLPFYNVPLIYLKAMECNDVEMLDLEGSLNSCNYSDKFQQLLWIEEAHQSCEMRIYDQTDAFISTLSNGLFTIEVTGLNEGRPSLLKGDRVMLKNSTHGSRYYEAYIHNVLLDKIEVKFNSSFKHAEGTRYIVQFVSSRNSFRRAHHAVKQYHPNPFYTHMLFPTPETLAIVKKPYFAMKKDGMFLFRQLNKIQRDAVKNILMNVCRPLPYILFGPPGTGKTVTLVEAILQAYNIKKNSRILVCGNSNASADVLAEKLKKSKGVPLDKIVRFSAHYRFDKEGLIPDSILDIARTADFDCPASFEKYRIIVTTCVNAAGFFEHMRRKFDFVFIDEAGHAHEPHALIALDLVKDDGCTVIAGDPFQLGPVIMSRVAKTHGLGLSILERLYHRVVDEKKPIFDGRFITKLCISYRSDPRVMQLNNEMFYHNQLIFKDSTPKWLLSRMRLKHPIVFHAVHGKEVRELDNPSWFNRKELGVVLCYLRKLYNIGLNADDVGIITPYKQQLNKLNFMIESTKLSLCKIGTIEEFQGLERKVIIISTVRTKKKHLSEDKKFNLGFLTEEKRFNVALSRAKFIVIVVGDPNLLQIDEKWAAYINACKQNKSFIEDTKRTSKKTVEK